MRLGNVLQWVHNMPYRYRGKYRKVKTPTMKDLVALRKDFEREEQNMFILRHPYLTPEQSHGHMTEIRVPPNPALDAVIRRNEKYSRKVRVMNRLHCLRMFEGWE